MSKILDQLEASFPSGRFHVPPTFDEYRRMFTWDLCPYDDLRTAPFVTKLLHYVAVNITPMCFLTGNQKERMAFTNPFGIFPVPLRQGRYANDALFSLAFLHEVLHALFGAPVSLQGLSREGFFELMRHAEYAASMASELSVYFWINNPTKLREDLLPVLPGRIVYDVARDNGMIELPTDDALIEQRRMWVENPATIGLFAGRLNDAAVRSWLSSFTEGNVDFLEERYEAMRLFGSPLPAVACLNPGNYSFAISQHNLSSTLSQEVYEERMLARMQMLSVLMGLNKPQSFEEGLSMLRYCDHKTLTI